MVYAARYTGNSRFGALFLWTGFTFQVLWICALPNLSPVLTRGDFAPVFIYSALTLAGIALLLPSNSERPASVNRRTHPDRHEFGAQDIGPRLHAEGGRCRTIAVGPRATLESALGPLFQSSGLTLEYAETDGIALQKISAHPRRDLPSVLLLPWLLEVVSPYFIRAIKSDRALGEVSIIVWGAGIPGDLIQSFYQAGVTCVIPSKLNEATSRALCSFCARVGAKSEGD